MKEGRERRGEQEVREAKEENYRRGVKEGRKEERGKEMKGDKGR